MPAPVQMSSMNGPRSCVADIVCLARQLPLFPVERMVRLAAVAEARTAAAARIGWAAVFLRAYGVVAREMPILRTWVVRGVRPRLATTADGVAILAVNRRDQDADRLCFGRLLRPEGQPLAAIQRFVDDCKTRPVAEMFRRQVQLEMLPGWLRRTILRWNLHSASPRRPGRLGTFSLSTLANAQAFNRFHPTLCTTSLTYGPLEADGRCLVTIIADHRILDGATVAAALVRLEEVLTTQIACELRAVRDPRAADPAAAAA